jgi:hypothetical protein
MGPPVNSPVVVLIVVTVPADIVVLVTAVTLPKASVVNTGTLVAEP